MSEAFVRTQMTPPQKPPVTERGAIKWLHENLFAGPYNTILTLVSLYVIYLMLSAIVPWLLNGVWVADSLQECRDIVAASAGEGATGACWAMLRERWHQFIFGLYPSEAYWRPTLAFGLLFVAIAPVLYSGQRSTLLTVLAVVFAFVAICLPLAGAPGWWRDAPDPALVAAGEYLSATALTGIYIGALALVAGLAALTWVAPGRLIWFTLAFPALCYFLLWGGSIWSTVAVVLGLVVLGVVYRLAVSLTGFSVAACLGLLAAVLYWLYLDAPLARELSQALPLGIPFIPSDEFGGFLLAIVIGVTAIAFSLPLGILLALGRQSDLPIVKMICVGFIEFIRGVPLITLLFTASLLLGYFLPPGTTFDTILRVMILVTFFAAAYLAEVVRGGLAALPRGQYEAADSLGLDYWSAQRLIILPQALKISIPAIVSTFIGLFKDTTLVSFVALMDPLRGVTNAVRADIDWKGIYWEPYIFVGAIFFLICFGMSRYSMYLEQKLKTDHR